MPVFGQTAGYAYEVLTYFVLTNMVLAVFNLLPVPPLDGYHVLNDLILKGRLYASRKLAGAGQAILFIALFTGVLSEGLNYVYNVVLGGVGSIAVALMRVFGLC